MERNLVGDVNVDLSQVTRQADIYYDLAIEFLPRLGAALIIFIVGYIAAVLVRNWSRRGIRAIKRVDPALAPVVSTALHYGIIIIVAVAALSQLGVQTTSVLAVVGAAGLAIGLALQGTLSNIAAGIMLLWLRPFTEGDVIETPQIMGTVREIGLFATEINTYDGVFRFVPNSALWNTPLFNYSRNPTRMADITIGIGYSSDIERAREEILAAAAADPRIRAEPKPNIFVNGFGDSAVNLRFQVWIGTKDFWATQRALMEDVKRRFDAAGIDIPFPQRVLHMIKETPPAA